MLAESQGCTKVRVDGRAAARDGPGCRLQSSLICVCVIIECDLLNSARRRPLSFMYQRGLHCMVGGTEAAPPRSSTQQCTVFTLDSSSPLGGGLLSSNRENGHHPLPTL